MAQFDANSRASDTLTFPVGHPQTLPNVFWKSLAYVLEGGVPKGDVYSSLVDFVAYPLTVEHF